MNIQVHPQILFLRVQAGTQKRSVSLHPELICDVDEQNRLLSVEAIGDARLMLLDALDRFDTDRLIETTTDAAGDGQVREFSEQEAVELFALLEKVCPDTD